MCYFYIFIPTSIDIKREINESMFFNDKLNMGFARSNPYEGFF